MKHRVYFLIIALILISGSILLIEQSRMRDVKRIELGVKDSSERISQKESKFKEAVELVDPDGYINVENITIAEQIGKNVVLLDIWTYTCINCQRTLPYITSWDEKYRDQGLVIIGIHTPEFEFEKDIDNVRAAVRKWGIEYPVILDNYYLTWNAYNNRYWPRKYLIDIDGFVVYDHIGEGGYEETENKIVDLLKERRAVLGLDEEVTTGLTSPIIKPNFQKIRTPELYFGYDFYRNQIGNKEGLERDQDIVYSYPEKMSENLFYLNGTWHNGQDGMTLASDVGGVKLDYTSKQVNIVAGADKVVMVNVYIDQELVNQITVKGRDLYTVYEGDDYEPHSLELRSTKGLEMYTFTFG